jgi:hypothetical protein
MDIFNKKTICAFWSFLKFKRDPQSTLVLLGKEGILKQRKKERETYSFSGVMVERMGSLLLPYEGSIPLLKAFL